MLPFQLALLFWLKRDAVAYVLRTGLRKGVYVMLFLWHVLAHVLF